MLAVINSRANEMHDHFAREFAYHASPLLNEGVIASTEYVPITWLRGAALRWLIKFDRLLTRYPLLAPLLAIPVGIAALATYVANLGAKGTHAQALRHASYSGVFAEFRLSGPAPLPEFEKDETSYWARKQIVRRSDPRVSVPHDN
jgi:hypothetical protein